VQCVEDDDCGNGSSTPKCNAEHACVECVEHEDCRDADEPRCKQGECVQCLGDEDCASLSLTPKCDTDSNLCVQCLSHGDCEDAANPQCDDHVCGRCSGGNDACTGRTNATICDVVQDSPTEGNCVECTPLDESPCDEHVCDPAARACTLRGLASKDTCEQCIADSECMSDHRCIQMLIGDESREGGYCLRLREDASSCVEPYYLPIRRRSLSAASAGDYCGINEDTTSCEAVLGLINNAHCPGGADSDCQGPGALCRTVGTLPNRCTYACSTDAQCPVQSYECSSGYCGGP
jgi:hypothetical protein